MSEKIEPALNAEEWRASTKALGPDWFGGKIVGGGDITIEGSDPQEAVTVSRPPHLAALIALANAALPDDDPRKITRDRIALLREVISEAFHNGNDAWPGITKMGAFADALESYLPPA